MIYKLFQAIDQTVGVEQAKAHCDIPCGIYDPIIAADCRPDRRAHDRSDDRPGQQRRRQGQGLHQQHVPLRRRQRRACRKSQGGDPRHLGRLPQGPAPGEVSQYARPGAQDHAARLQSAARRSTARPPCSSSKPSTSLPRSSGKPRTSPPSAPRPPTHPPWSWFTRLCNAAAASRSDGAQPVILNIRKGIL